MSGKLNLLLAQINLTVGDLAGNAARLYSIAAKFPRIDLIATPELSLTGYPVEDLANNRMFLAAVKQTAEKLAKELTGFPGMIVGAPWEDNGKIYNALLLLHEGKAAPIHYKHELPNYGVFDERRNFTPGPLAEPLFFKGFKLGLLICEDMWEKTLSAHHKAKGADILLALNGSPFAPANIIAREGHAKARQAETGLPLLYLNQIGGQDEIVFDGGSFVLDAKGQEISRAASFREHFLPVVITKEGIQAADKTERLPDVAAIYYALTLGLRDYVQKNGFEKVIIGLSGGVDSALVAALAVDALGSKNVRVVMLQSPYTSSDSLNDAEAVAGNLGLRLENLSIIPAMRTLDQSLGLTLEGAPKGLTAENIQSRLRGMMLMALANSSNALLLSTANKSEAATGYGTLYGDLCGALAPLKDVYKTKVYKLCQWRNQDIPNGALGPKRMIIPSRILTKAPTAELRPNQKDEDSLPPYETLDKILKLWVEEEVPREEIIAQGFEAMLVDKVLRLVDLAEYKRRQAPPGLKISKRAFGRDRRYPITNRFILGQENDIKAAPKTNKKASS